MTKGEYRVDVGFNPSQNMQVNMIKRRCAELIDAISKCGGDDVPEVHRLRALACTAIEEGAMWAVKAATKGPTP